MKLRLKKRSTKQKSCLFLEEKQRKIHKPLARLTKEIVRKTQVNKIIDDTGNNITDIPEK